MRGWMHVRVNVISWDILLVDLMYAEEKLWLIRKCMFEDSNIESEWNCDLFRSACIKAEILYLGEMDCILLEKSQCYLISG